MKHLFLLLIIFTFPCAVKAQLTDIARVEYTYFPQSDSENSFKRFRIFGNVPFQIDDDAYIVAGFEYRNIFLKLEDPFPFATTDIERYQSFKASLGYTDKLKNGWRYAFLADVRIASNLQRSLVRDDIIFGGSVYAIRDKTGDDSDSEKPWRLILGLVYSTTAGRPFPLPFINYYREFAPKWTYTLGIPKSNIKYEFVPNMRWQGYFTLDGFFANIQNNVAINDGSQNVASNISMRTLLSGIGYEWEFVEHCMFYVYGGYTLLNDIRLEDANDTNVYTINNTGSFYTRGGIKIKI